MSELSEDLERFERAAMEISKAIERKDSGNSATISVNADGVGVWISATACGVMFALFVAAAVVGSVAYTNMQTRLDRMQDYINVIYQVAPQLKPKETKP